jgi:pyruvate/2-oxoglutarate dehydrogenase complex dihydrolipoamide acyltransferase (E2) component
MRRLALLALSVAVAAFVVAGCGDSSSSASPPPPPPPPATSPPPPATTTSPQPAPPPPPSKPTKPWRSFTKAELAKVALQPKDAPADLGYLRRESGLKTLADIGLVLPAQQRLVRRLGFRAAYDSVFAAKGPSDRRIAERIWLFKTRDGATRWLAKGKKDSADLEFSPVDAPALGEESWAARGLIQVAGGQAITHSFRLGNAVFTVLMYGEQTPPTEAGALAAAQAGLARAKAAG